MNDAKFKSMLIQSDYSEKDYARGYKRGLRRLFHGENFGTEEEHQQYLNLADHQKNIRLGYRDGFSGKRPVILKNEE